MRACLALLMLVAGLAFGRVALAIPPEAKYVGEKVCVGCHQVENKHFGHSLHAKVFRQNPKNDVERQVCEACHGPGAAGAGSPQFPRVAGLP